MLFHAIDHIKCVTEAKLSHIIRVRIVIDHHLKFIRSHHTIESVKSAIRTVIASCRKHSADFDQHLNAILFGKRSISCHLLIDPDTVRHSRRCLKLKARMLPKIAAFASTDCRDRVECPLTVKILGTFTCLFQCCISEIQKIFCRLLIMKQEERKTVGFRIPECISVICLSGQSFGSNIRSADCSVIRLKHLENTEPNSLLVLLVTADRDV